MVSLGSHIDFSRNNENILYNGLVFLNEQGFKGAQVYLDSPRQYGSKTLLKPINWVKTKEYISHNNIRLVVHYE